MVPSATPIAGGDREWLSQRRGRLLTGQSWYRWPKEQRTPLLYHALARAKSPFNKATKVFVDTALSDPTPYRHASRRRTPTISSAGFIIDAMAPILFPARGAVPRALSAAIGRGAAA